jgi:adenylosuccinate synthase
MELLRRKVNIVLDGQWGSTGKGKLCGYLGRCGRPDVVCSSFGPNTGHTFVDTDGKATVLKSLPSSALTAPDALVLVMPDSVFRPQQLLKEAEIVGVGRVRVHPRAAVVTDEDKLRAGQTGRHLAGTMQGTGHAISRKLLRIEGIKLAKDVLPGSMIADTCQIVRDNVGAHNVVLFEMSQGFDLSLNHGFDYPYLTSRDITVGAAINSLGVSDVDVAQVIGSIRTFPIRVGNVDGGWSGPHHPDQCELTWTEVTERSGSQVELLERTTVTKRVRRVFTFSMLQLQAFVEHCRPDWLFLNFAQYINAKDAGVERYDELSDELCSFIDRIERAAVTRVRLIGTGAGIDEMVVRDMSSSVRQ